ncbi:HEAT repeat domain-containing protein [Chlorogloeopsis sp. ULAP02]|uniref:HEAT repeat domain-containing protein n=1 Tax=Chlorogloeopsis sp. ULAP02 TaxID=3107926 RepID=UPI003136EB15
MDSADNYIEEQHNDPRSTEELIQIALAQENEYTFRDIVSILHFRGSLEVFEAASRLCKSQNPKERELGVDILGQLGIPKRSFPYESVNILLQLLEKEEDTEVLGAIGVALGHLKDSRGIQPLVKLKNHASANVRFGVVFGLLSQTDELAINTLIDLSADEDADVRNWATFGLGSMIEINSPAIRDALFKRLIDEKNETETESEIRGEALLGLAIRRDERVVNLLIEELTSKWVGKLAVEAAKEVGDSRLYTVLIRLKEWWNVDNNLLKEAIENCKPEELDNRDAI